MKKTDKEKKGHATLIVIIAVAIVAGISLLPLEKLSDGKISDFSLVSDIIHDSLTTEVDEEDPKVEIDPELAQMMKADTVAVGNTVIADSIADSIPPAVLVERTESGVLPIEDYTADGKGVCRLRQAIASGRFARIAIVGDSYIEGDIFSQNVREKLQSLYGGSGVGYVNMYSEFPGFRRSVKQSGKGWTAHIAGKKGTSEEYIGLSESYFTVDESAWSQYKGTNSLANLGEWDVSRFLFVASASTNITASINGVATAYPVSASDSVQEIRIVAPATSDFKLSVASTAIKGLGVWLDSSTGIGVDCMSSRGFSGLTLANISRELCSQMRRFVNYDLIILEFGINAMAPNQKKFTVYSSKMAEVVEHVRKCYPDADILLMGIGDRGQKKGGVVKSMNSVPYMIEAQRQTARMTRCLFWDTRAAMGGEDAIVDWAQAGRANKDYIHLTHKGGEVLAEEFVNALKLMLQ